MILLKMAVCHSLLEADKILIRDKPGSTMTLTCGKQPAPTRILVEYSEKAPAGVDGEVRVIEFLGGSFPGQR